MSQVIGAVQIKGGVGKSTLVAHLAAFAVKRGLSVAVVDTDVQQAAARWLGEALPEVETITALVPDDALEAIPELRKRHQLVIADGPAGESEITRALMLRADLVLVPCGPSVLDLRALRETAHLVRQVRSIRDGVPDALVILNRQQPRTLVSQEVIAAVPELGLRVAEQIIQQRTAVADAVGQATFVWDMGAAAREAAREFETLFTEILNLGSEEEGPTVGA